MAEQIWVAASKQQMFLGKVACYDCDVAHVTPDNPDGILDISPCSVSGRGYEPRLVASTPWVQECVRQGRLVLVSDPETYDTTPVEMRGKNQRRM